MALTIRPGTRLISRSGIISCRLLGAQSPAGIIRLSQLQLYKRLEGAAGRHPLEFEVPRNSFHRPVPYGWEACTTSVRSEQLVTRWCYCSARVALFYPAECKLPWCCRATAVPNEGWLDAMARENMIYYSSD